MQQSSLSGAQPQSISQRHTLVVTLLLLAAVVAWDAGGQDLAWANAFGTPSGFPLREHWFFVQVMHEGARRIGWLVVLALALSVWWPLGILRRLDASERLQMALSALLGLAVVSVIKNLSNTSCPWDLAAGRDRWRRRPLLPRRSCLSGLCVCGGLLCAAPQATRCGTVVAGGRGAHGPGAGWLAAGARRAFHEPHPVDRLAVLDHRLAGGLGCRGPAPPHCGLFALYPRTRGRLIGAEAPVFNWPRRS